jgi:hypothetical protein
VAPKGLEVLDTLAALQSAYRAGDLDFLSAALGHARQQSGVRPHVGRRQSADCQSDFPAIVQREEFRGKTVNGLKLVAGVDGAAAFVAVLAAFAAIPDHERDLPVMLSR